jgi:hypothetical protein
MQFNAIGKAVAKQFQAMTATGLYRTQAEKDVLWETYLASFPEGSNPIYKERTEHDCNCCKSFIRTLGGVVSIVDGNIVTIWDINVGGPYQVVADAMAEYVKNCAIDNLFLHPEKMVGTVNSRQLLEDKSIITWDHYFVNLPNDAVVRGEQIGPQTSEARSTFDVMFRSLNEITIDAIDTVLDLIAQNSLYRGEEHTFALTEFRKLKVEWMRLRLDGIAQSEATIAARDLFVWPLIKTVPKPVSRMRSTVIGTLLTGLSDGVDMEDAVKMFESKVAPTNYKRPTALVTKAMIAKAQEKVNELGFTSALERRYATIDDITINNVLYADRAAKKAMNVFDDIAACVPESTKKLDKVEEVSIEDFLTKILPKAESLEVMFENRHAGNLVSLIAPADPTAKTMFKWPNNFSWSYTGEVTDSIKERVKAAGGSVTGDLCCRLAWEYKDDLDFHMYEPGGNRIFYGNKRQLSPNGGMLDLDANGGDGIVQYPAENIYYSDKCRMREGVYELQVNNYCRRSDGHGFEVEIEFDGEIRHIVYDKVMRTGDTLTVAKIQYSKLNGFKVIESMPSTQTSKTIWNVPTQTFHKVSVVMLSPNYWDDKSVLNKHYFFMLDNCLNEGRARGFFNEFLTEALTPHRKVFEIVGSKMKTDESDRQLSGLGFSSTQRNHLLCRVNGSFTRTVKIVF